ncbi:MAG TPA: APC family permease [Sphingomicrobium sp.]|nr:APC family permease [Sphingomicrobium sp.]
MATKHDGAAGELLRILGIGFGLAVVVGGVVGQGIMRTPGIVAGALPSEAWVLGAWALGGLIILIDACATVELGASVPRSGGPYVFAERAFGPTAGAMLGWADALNYILGMSYVSVVFAEYAQRLGIGAMLPTGALAVLLIAILGAINWTGTRTSGRSQIVGTALKGAGLTLLVLVLWVMPVRSGSPTAVVHALPPLITIAAIGTAMRAVAITYGGWNAAVYCSEEMCQPERSIVRVTFGGIGMVIILFLAVNGALFHVLSRGQIAASNLPVADATSAVLGAASGKVITVLAILAVVTICNLMVMFVSRIVFAMARNGILPAFLTRVSKSGTPRMALLCSTVIAAFLASTGSYERLIAIGAPFLIGVPAVTDLAAIAMRVREPELERPFKMPLFPLPALLGFAVNALLVGAIFYEDPLDSSLGVGLVVLVGIATKIHGTLTMRRAAAA